jgi:CubicO group peptidase (beta-lactamase class C family)
MHVEMRTRLAVMSVVLLAATAATRGQQAGVSAPAGLFPPLEPYLEALRQQAGVPGMSAAVVQDGAIVWERGFGFQNVAARVRATPDTPYVVGDISGTLAAVLLLQCVEQRRLTLDEPTRTYGITLPEPGVTLRHLLSYSSADSPGEAFNYSPERYGMLTSAVEQCVPTVPYRKIVADRLLDPLAMKDSVPGTDLRDPNLVLPDDLFDPADVDRYRRVLARLAVPYKVENRNRAERTELPLAPITAAAGLVSTVRDLARLDTALDTELLLQADTLAVAWTPVIGRGDAPLPTGLGWFVQSYRGERVVWRYGLIPNAYSSLIVKLPARHLTFILLANSEGLSAPFQLSSGDVTRSLFATLFLRLAT